MTGLFPEPAIAAPAPQGLGRMMAGGGSQRPGVERQGNDYYPTPPMATRAFLAAERRHLLGDLGCTYVALLLKATYWHAEKRTGLWRWRTPVRIYALNWRLDCLGLGNPTMEFIWVVWDARRDGPCQYDVLTPFRAPDLLGEG